MRRVLIIVGLFVICFFGMWWLFYRTGIAGFPAIGYRDELWFVIPPKWFVVVSALAAGLLYVLGLLLAQMLRRLSPRRKDADGRRDPSR